MRGYGPRDPRLSKRLYNFWSRYFGPALGWTACWMFLGAVIADQLFIWFDAATWSAQTLSGVAGWFLMVGTWLTPVTLVVCISNADRAEWLWGIQLAGIAGCLLILGVITDPTYLHGSWMAWLQPKPDTWAIVVFVSSTLLLTGEKRLTVEARERRVAFQRPARPGL